MAIDLAEYGITVNAIAPGPIETPRSAQAQSPRRREAWIRATPLRRYGTPADVAGAAAFLASEDASYITGATIPVDGGFTAAGILIDIPRRS
jgi:NAD(P)-dependent dehydrogenase (short-subunit alcohol dehydrogenase family)